MFIPTQVDKNKLILFTIPYGMNTCGINCDDKCFSVCLFVCFQRLTVDNYSVLSISTRKFCTDGCC